MVLDQAPGSFSNIIAELDQNWGQSFKSSVDGLVEKFTIYLNNDPPFSFLVGNIYARIWTHDGVYGSSSIGVGLPGDELSISSPLDVSTIPSGFDGAYMDFDFSPSFRIKANQPYVLTIDGIGDIDGAILVPINFTNSSSHSGNAVYFDGVNWSTFGSYDLSDWTLTGSLVKEKPDFEATNTTVVDEVGTLIDNDNIFVEQLGVDGATPGQSIIITDGEGNLVLNWTCKAGEESKLFKIKRPAKSMKFVSITGTIVLYGEIENIQL